MGVDHLQPELRGRRAECEVLDGLLGDVGSGRGRVLVLRGEAGVGKSALLDHLRSRAADFRVEQASGVESEMELPFAALQQLCAPMLDLSATLPEPQRAALETALGLAEGTAGDRFLVGLAVLSLLSAAGERRPLICVVDDAQWLDRSSAQALAFVARRLQADAVGIVAAIREPFDDPEMGGLPSLPVGGLGITDARALLEEVTHGRIDVAVRDRIIAEAGGNPLALLELPRSLRVEARSAGFALPTGPIASRIERTYQARIEGFPDATRRLLLTAASEPSGDVGLLWRAAEVLGIEPSAAEPAERAELVVLDRRVRFRHPLVRSAAYRAATPPERREAHAAIAAATDPEVDPDRRAWHLAHAAATPDEEVADELERSAERATARGGVAAAAAFLARATELTPEPARRGGRALAAAHAEFEAGAVDAADDLLSIAEAAPLDALRRGLLARLRAQIAFARRRGSDAPPLLLAAARSLHSLDDALARETYLEALGAAMFSGRLGGATDLEEVAHAALGAPPAPRPPRPMDLLLDGMATLVTDGRPAGVPALRRAMHPLQHEVLRSRDDTMRWLWLSSPIAQEAFVHQLWDYEAWDGLATRAVQLARDTGALSVLPVALAYLAGARLHAGDLATAGALTDEADAITESTGYARVSYASVVLAAWQGDEAAATDRFASEVDDAVERGEGTVVAVAGYAQAVLYNALGRYDVALAGATDACATGEFGWVGWALTELVEAGVRSGARDDAATAMGRLRERTQASGTDWALGIEARSQALLLEGAAAEGCYVEALERLERSRVAVHLARAHLVYGEWLRREDRRSDARWHLGAAHDMFERFGARAFADRARRELVATGGTARTRSVDTRDLLTPQEAQVASLAADGHTNPEIGGQLFISPRTVEYHLGKVFTKLGIRSRRELRGALRAQGARRRP